MFEKNSKVRDTELRVRPSEIDPYAIVHHSNYLCWVIMGIADYLNHEFEDVGDRRRILTTDIEVLELKCKYIQSATIDDNIIVKIKLVNTNKQDGLMMFFKYEVRNKKKSISLVNGTISIKLNGYYTD